MAKNLAISYLLDVYGEMLTDKQKDAVELYYNEDLSLAEIAEHLSITRQGVRDSIKRAENQLLECEDKMGLARRFRGIAEGLTEIISCASVLEADSVAARSPRSAQTAHRIIEVANELNL